MMQAGHQAASSAVDSDDSDDEGDFDQYSELDAFDTDEVEVSPDDEQALAAFMVSVVTGKSVSAFVLSHAAFSAYLCLLVVHYLN